MIKGLTTAKALIILPYMYAVFTFISIIFMISVFWFHAFDHWMASIAPFVSWVILCIYSHLIKYQITKGRDAINKQHEEKMTELRTMNPKL